MPAAESPSSAPLLSESIREKIRAYIPRYPDKRAVTLPALHIVHEHLRCVPYKAMEEIAEILDLQPSDVHDTMSFYGFFPQAPIGEKRVWICRSISCMLRGGDELLGVACKAAGVAGPGSTSADGELTIEFAECLGICDHAPAALCDDGRIYGPLDEQTVAEMIQDVRSRTVPPDEIPL
ncbi:NADH-quinone oxidoreductase subunit NuoE family protein [Tautonia sociabilis]|uniref:NAD(P)H-dependent oxidoreductase subunit E n=1 Tax=Tautonia sociabilis TaxID=2080755 RepID=A0A432MLU7_9BACT|nr:NAD(P)H-dependent oxidoreductase subunit E [Tautonia sociabilis]RUL88372.1 NAD(P)H-dependent oxidoreductase subunit E [Tautonia sociabilis]